MFYIKLVDMSFNWVSESTWEFKVSNKERNSNKNKAAFRIQLKLSRNNDNIIWFYLTILDI